MSKSTVVAKAGFREMFTDILLNNIYIYIYLFISLITSEKPLMGSNTHKLTFQFNICFFYVNHDGLFSVFLQTIFSSITWGLIN